MIGKLKIKFILLSMTSLFVLLLVIVAGMNAINYTSVCREADEILSLLSQNRGMFPDFEDNRGHPMPPGMSPELPYESRYFSVVLDDSGDVIYAETSRIFSVDTGTAIEYAQTVMVEGKRNGFLDDYRFLQISEDDTIRITFLDWGRKLDTFHSFLFTSVGIALAGFVIVFFVISFFAGRIIRPIAESYEKQKRFITDAGHEIRTPLAIITANVDVLEMDLGENESLEDIRQQTKRLTSLTNDLVYLARMEESEDSLLMIEFPISEVVLDAAMPFRTLAKTQDKEFVCRVQPMLSVRGNEKAIRQLVSILMDNAIKYSPSGGAIALSLAGKSRSVILTVCNTTETDVDPASLPHIFDRFYRMDPSRNSNTGGHGIGLSMAKAIASAHGGRIQAQTQDGHSFQITVTLPA